jgi:hypothetical protein
VQRIDSIAFPAISTGRSAIFCKKLLNRLTPLFSTTAFDGRSERPAVIYACQRPSPRILRLRDIVS